MFEGVSTFSILLALIVIIVVLILFTLITVVIYSGLFHGIDDVGTGKPPIGQMIIAYKFQRGPYNESGQLFTEAAIIAPDNKALGIYYDDPNKVDSIYLRYAVGSIISEGETPVDEAMVKKFTENDFKILHLPEVTYAVRTKFPHITTLSILIAVRKAYPRMQQYVEEHKLCAHPYMELYDGHTIHFLAPLSKQAEFYVPECNCTSGGAGGDTTNEWESSSELTADGSLDVTQTTVDSWAPEDVLEESPEREGVNVEADAARKDENESEVEKKIKACEVGKAKQEEEEDDDHDSDGSASSFEVVKQDSDI